jgi:hypothetical protein
MAADGRDRFSLVALVRIKRLLMLIVILLIAS